VTLSLHPPVNFPHFFLDTNQDLADHLLTVSHLSDLEADPGRLGLTVIRVRPSCPQREYYLARIISITERTVDPKSLTSATNVG
jgi:hypothetical protein